MPGPEPSRFQILEKIGEGGRGVVYRALDRKLGRTVALKTLPAEKLRDPDRLQRFLREARAASALNHPGIVTVHDILELEDGAYLVLELIEGKTLAELIPEAGLDLPRALRYATRIAGAIAAAHDAGIVHRDIKPGNVMVTPADEVKVLDFGLAKSLAPDAAEPETLTRVGTRLGTAAYMSPEQALGEPVDARSDVFSFGVLLYQMLTGDLPFEATSGRSLLRQIVSGRPVPLRRRRAELPAALEALIERTLAKERQDRPARMGELADELEAIGEAVLSGSSAPAAEAPTLILPHAAVRRRRWPLIAAAGLAVALAGLLLTPGLRQRVAGGGEASPEREAGEVAGDSSYRLFQQGLINLRRHDRPESIERAIESFQGAIAERADYAPAYAGLARAHWRKYRTTKDQVWLDLALKYAEHARELDPHLSLALVSLGHVRIARGELDAAAAELERAVRLDPGNADAHRGLGDLRRRRGDFDGAEEAYLRAIELAPANDELHGSLGSLYYRNGRYAEAAAAFARTIELAPERSTGYKNMAAALHMQGRYAEAAEQLQTALQIRPDPKVYTNLGTLYFFQGLYAEAVSAFERAVELGANDYRIWGNLGDAYRWAPGARQKAAAAYERAVELVEAELAEAPEDPEMRSRLALFLVKGGDPTRGAALLDELDSEMLTANGLYRVAVAREISGDRRLALESLGRALEKGYGLAEVDNDPELARLHQDPAYVALRAGATGTES